MRAVMNWGSRLVIAMMLAAVCMAQDKPAEPKKDEPKKEAAKPAETQAAAPVAATEPAPPKAAADDVPPEYVLGPQDGIGISVWREPEFSGPASVRTDGKITLNLVGDIQAAGLTPMQLASAIAEKLKKYLAEPRVTVTVTAMNSQKFYIMGEVTRGGAFPLLPGTTMLQALAAAGGFSESANLKKIYLMRKENGKENKYYFNYREALKGEHPEQNLILKPGDTIVVP